MSVTAYPLQDLPYSRPANSYSRPRPIDSDSSHYLTTQPLTVPLSSDDDIQKPFEEEEDIELDRAAEISHVWLVCKILIITFILTMILVVPILVWLWFILINQTTTWDWSSRDLLTTANSTRTLLLSSYSSHAVGWLIPPIFALYAYVPASHWLTESRKDPLDRRQLLSPLQLATAMSLFISADASAILRSINFKNILRTFGLGRLIKRHSHPLKAPSFLKRCKALLAWLIFLQLALEANDYWLHFDAETTLVPTSSNLAKAGYANNADVNFARTINTTLCESLKAEYPKSVNAQTCGLINGGTSSGFNTRPQGVKAYTNTSTLHSVAWLDDSTAILTTPVAPNIGFNATTTGIKTSCQSITTQCVDCTSYEPDTTMSCTGPEADILINCRGPALYNLSLGYPNPDASSYIGGILSPTTGNSNPGEVDTNPFPWGNVVDSDAYFDVGLPIDFFIGNTGFVAHGHADIINILFCQISVVTTTYEFEPPTTYRQLTSQPSDHDTLVLMGWAAQLAGDAASINSAIDGAGQEPGGETYAEIYARQLSRWLVAHSAPIMMETAPLAFTSGRAPGTRITAIGILLVLLLDALTILTYLLIGIFASVCVFRHRSHFIKAAHSRFRTVLPLIGDVFGGQHHDKKTPTMYGDDKNLFEDEKPKDRLVLKERRVERSDTQAVRLTARKVEE